MENKGRVAELRHVSCRLPELLHGKFMVIFCLISLATLCFCICAGEQEKTTDYWMNKATESRYRGSFEESAQAYDKALQIDPEDVHSWSVKAGLLSNMKKYNESLQAYDRVLKMDPKNYTALINKGHDLKSWAFENYNKALEITSQILEKNPNDALAWQGKGAALSGLGSVEGDQAYAKAIEILDNYTKENPENASAWFLKGENYANMHKVEDALTAYEKVIELNFTPRLEAAFVTKAVLLAELQRFDEALEASEKAIELNPKSTAALSTKDYVLRELVREDEAAGVDAANASSKELKRTEKSDIALMQITNVTSLGEDEFIEIANNGNETQSFKNMTLVADEVENKSVALPDISLEPGEKIRIHFGQGETNRTDLFLNSEVTLDDVAGNLTLKDQTADTVGFMTYWTPADYWMKKAGELSSNGSFEEAVLAIDKAIEIEPQNATLWDAKGLGLMMIEGFVLLEDLGRSKEALKAFDRALELDNRDAQAWRGKGDALYMMGRYEDAIKAYDMAIQLDPESDMAHLGKGNALKVLLRNDEAMKSFDRALEINPNSAEAWGSKGYVFSNMFQSENATLAYGKALQLYEDRLKRDPRDFNAWIGKGDSLGYMGLVTNNLSSLSKLNEAALAFDRAIEINSGNAKGWFRNGEVLSLVALFKNESETYNQSLQALDTALEINPEYAEAWKIKGATLMDLKRYNESAEAFKKALEIAPGLPGALEGRAMALKELGKTDESTSTAGAFEEAIEAYDQIIKAANSSYELSYAWISKGIALYELSRYEEAFNALDNATEADPNNLMAWMTLADALASQRRFNESLAAYDKTIETIPANSTGQLADTLFRKADVLLEAKRTDEASRAIDEAIQIDPENDYVWAARGDLLNKTGRYEEALAAYDKAIEALSSSQSLRATAITSKAWHDKGNALNALGRMDEADEAFAKARELGFRG